MQHAPLIDVASRWHRDDPKPPQLLGPAVAFFPRALAAWLFSSRAFA